MMESKSETLHSDIFVRLIILIRLFQIRETVNVPNSMKKNKDTDVNCNCKAIWRLWKYLCAYWPVACMDAHARHMLQH